MSSLDPNVIITAVIALGGFIWNKLHGRKANNIADVLAGLAKQEIARLAADPSNIALARSRIELALRSGLERLGVKPSKAVDLAVAYAVEKAMGELAEQVAKHVLPAQLAELAQRADKLMQAFEPKGLTK